MVDAVSGKFWFKLQTKRYGRITQFFDDIDHKLYLATMNTLRVELERVREYIAGSNFNAGNMFNEVVRPRETLIKFSEPRVVLADKGEQKLQDLFKHYVERTFLTKEYKEAAMEKSVRAVLRDFKLADKYSRKSLTDGVYEASFPFVSENKKRVIKPLHLGHEKPSQAMDHGLSWLYKVDELRERRVMIDKVLFTVNEPAKNTKVHDVYESLINRFKSHDIEVSPLDDEDTLVQFAKY